MTEPKKVVVLHSGLEIPRGTRAWVHESANGRATVEHRNKLYKIPAEALREAQAPRPSLDTLCALDPCFGTPKALHEVVRDTEKMFIVYNCPHRRTFLRDARGGVTMMDRLICVEAAHENKTPLELWAHYHHISDDLLNHWGLAL